MHNALNLLSYRRHGRRLACWIGACTTHRVMLRRPLFLSLLLSLSTTGLASAQTLQAGTAPAPTEPAAEGAPAAPEASEVAAEETAPAAPIQRALPRDASGEARMLRRINALRRQQGHPPLQRNERLDLAADVHSRDMAARSQLAHVSPETGTPADRVRRAEVNAQRIAQNVARQPSTRAALAAILDSEAHRAQLLDEQFTHIGLSAVQAGDGVYVTQVMAAIAPPAEEQLPPPAVAELQPPRDSVELTTPEASPTVANAEPPQGGQTLAPTRLVIPGPQPRPTNIPSIRVPAGHRRVAGYWLHQHGRWWYFPVPPGTPPGTVVRPDLRFEGPPPGMAGQQPQAAPQRAPARAPQVRPSPQVHPAPPARTVPPSRSQGTVYWY